MIQTHWRSSTAFVTFVVCVAVFTDIFMYGLVVPMLPFALSSRIGLSDSVIQLWVSIVLASYGASILLGSLLFGWLGDRTKNKKTPFLLGLVMMGCATLLFALSRSLTLLLVARVFQGLSTAIVFTIGFSLLVDAVGNEHIGRALGFTSMSLSLGLFGGPIIGGFIYDRAGYLVVFVPAFVLIVLEIILRLLLRSPSETPSSVGSLDPTDPSENSPLLLRLPQKHKTSSPALLALLRSVRFLVAMTGMCMLNLFMTAFEAVLPVYMRELFDYSSSQIAIIFLSNTLPMVLSPVSGTLVDRIGSFWPAVAGFALATPSMMLLGIIQHDTVLCSILMRVFLFAFGSGVSMAMPAMMTEISMAAEAVEHQRPGIFGLKGAYSTAYGLSNAAFAGGTLAGPLFAGYVRECAGWTAMSIALGLLSMLMTLLIVLCTRPKSRPVAEGG
ncbi:hypothetical protein FE257_005931 [Aspergillus nanangensis]|uniref:Major facilitator superfamily (MFS) profile domain-containing protein n=1 Tax=Aspergillus nanangensis TaxID=2582783 RepID=A0AAD4CPZ9_ASPNN|nr:hypothetical protein FE257_005931 [Aspergillus nanangensis]